MSLKDLLTGVQDGALDVAVAALTITAGREERVDFSHAFHTTGLGIAVQKRAGSAWLLGLKRLLSWEFLGVLLGLMATLGVVGWLMWLCEHRRNAPQFDARPGPGIGAGFWWAAVTMTTVGYGDKAPQTFAGRLLGLIWMFAGIVLISGFTAALTTVLTVTELGTTIRGPEDLAQSRVGTATASTSAEYL